MCKFHVIGISDQAAPDFTPEVKRVISSTSVFSGGSRHYELVKELLPPNHQWIDVLVPLKQTLEQYRQIKEAIVVFASGDPLFFGIANTIRRELPNASMRVYSCFNSLQMLAQHCLLPYGNMHIATLTGRPWENLDKELINGTGLIGVLSDRKKTPSAIAQRMLDAGLTNYKVYLGERMGGERQIVRELSVEALSDTDTIMPNCLILEKTSHFERTAGIHESAFNHLAGRPKMITKRSLRLMSLSMLKLDTAKVFWDIGFCTGSVSIEVKQAKPAIEVFAIEKREESAELMASNQKKFCTPGINWCIDDFYTCDLEQWNTPDRVFIGGHGGKLPQMLERLNHYLQPGGIIVFNAVSSETASIFIKTAMDLKLVISDQMHLTQDDHNPVSIIQASKPLNA